MYELLLTILIVTLVVIAFCISYDVIPPLVIKTEDVVKIKTEDVVKIKTEDYIKIGPNLSFKSPSMFNMSVRKTIDGYSGLVRGVTGDHPSFSYPYNVSIDDSGSIKDISRIDLDYSELTKCKVGYRGILANGIEDPRLFLYRNEEWAIANCLGSSIQAHPCVNAMCIFKLSDPKSTFKLLSPPEGVNPLQSQKNWSPFEWNDRLLCEYTLVPHRILEIDISTGATKTLVESSINDDKITRPLKDIDIRLGHSLRGGGPPIRVHDDYYLGIGHTRRAGTSDYYHFFYKFEAAYPFRILRISRHFKMEVSNQVQFAAGLSLYEDYIYVSYGVDDKYNRISRYRLKDVLNFINSEDSEFIQRLSVMNEWTFSNGDIIDSLSH